MPTATKMTRTEFLRRHLRCTPALFHLKAFEGLEAARPAGQQGIKVLRDHNNEPTGEVQEPGGKVRLIQGHCNHPEDGVCGFDPIPQEVLIQLLKDAGKIEITEPKVPAGMTIRRNPTVPQPTKPEEIIIEEEPDEDGIAVCPSCGSPFVEVHDTDGRYLKCTDCNHIGTAQSFYDDSENDDDTSPSEPETPAVAEEQHEAATVDEPEEDEFTRLSKMYNQVLGR